MAPDSLNAPQMTLGQKAWQIHWTLLVLTCCIAVIGVTMLYSAGNGSFDPWASRHVVRFVAGLGALIVVALVDIRIWLRHAYVLYLLTLVLLGVVEVCDLKLQTLVFAYHYKTDRQPQNGQRCELL